MIIYVDEDGAMSDQGKVLISFHNTTRDITPISKCLSKIYY